MWSGIKHFPVYKRKLISKFNKTNYLIGLNTQLRFPLELTILSLATLIKNKNISIAKRTDFNNDNSNKVL